MSFVYLDIDLSQHVHISLGREAKGRQNSEPLGGKRRTSGRQFGAEEGDVVEFVVVDLVANGHDDVADETVAQLGRVRQLAQDVRLGFPTGTGDVILEEVAIERVEGFGQGHDGSEDGLLDFGVSVGKGKDFAAASHSAAARRRIGTGRRIQLAAFRLESTFSLHFSVKS